MGINFIVRPLGAKLSSWATDEV